ncbi:MAB_1171c family putative transporter [Streptomyces sp. NPDC127106]|uniref:MAB_1171c family putative transporter n=1 Tax=Streptomyces sp. NPDC127106 TaxID=3345360 RepID=UPI003637A147
MTDRHEGAIVAFEVFGVGAMVLVTLLRAPAALRSSEQRALWLAVALASVAMSLQIAQTRSVGERLPAGPHGVLLLTELIGMFAATAVSGFVLRLAGRARLAVASYAAAVCLALLLLGLDAAAAAHTEHGVPDDPGQGVTPGRAYWILLLGYHVTASLSCGVLCWIHVTRTPNLPLRFGLLTFGTGVLLAALLAVLSLLHILTRWSWAAGLFPWVSGAEALLMAGGTGVPLVLNARRRARDLRTLHRLYRLWHDLTHRVPQVMLAPVRGRAGDLLASVRHPQLHLYRRTIEIQDALLTLGGSAPPTLLDEARRHVDERRVPPAESAAAITACWLKAVPTPGPRASARPGLPADPYTVVGGEQWSDERFLLQLAGFYGSAMAADFARGRAADGCR